MSSKADKIIKNWLKDTSQKLILNGLGLKKWPKGVKENSKKIIELDCSDNELKIFGFNLPECIDLFCANCNFKKLTRLPKCNYLDCSNNKIITLPVLRKCEVLLCNNNKIKTINPKNYDSLSVISYFDNPLKKEPAFRSDVKIYSKEELSKKIEVEEEVGEEEEFDIEVSEEEFDIEVSEGEVGEVEEFDIEVSEGEVSEEEEFDVGLIDESDESDEEEDEVGLIDESLEEEEDDEIEEEVIVGGVKMEKAYFTLKKPISPSKQKTDIMNLIPEYKGVKVYRLVPIKKITRDKVPRAKKIELNLDFSEIRELDIPKKKETEELKIVFEIEKIPPKTGRWPKGKVYYEFGELKEIAKQLGLIVINNRFKIVSDLISVYLDIDKIPPTLNFAGKDNYYTKSQMNSFFRGLGISKSLNYTKKVENLKKIY